MARPRRHFAKLSPRIRPAVSEASPGAKRASAKGSAPPAPLKRPSAADESSIRRTLRKMSLEEKLGQLLMIPFFGEFLSAESAAFQELVRAVERLRVGGLIVHSRRGPQGIERSRAYPTAALIDQLQRRAGIPLLVAGDFERGTAMRLEEGTSFPHAMAVAATNRLEDAYTMGRITALEARALGAPWIFAPVADVNSDPENPIINIRSFGEDPARVAKLVTAYVRGVEENGALATAKHFPGHGNTHVDSHLDLPTVESDRAHLERVELAPFRAAIAAGVSAMMTGHIAVPALDPEPGMPTTFSAKITDTLLRRRMHFGGLVATDDLSMGGVSLRHTTAESAVRAVLAGGDMLLAFTDVDSALAGLHEAAESGRLPVERIDDAVTRVLRAKARLGLHRASAAQRGGRVNLDALPGALARPDFSRAAADIADRGVTLLRDQSGLLPLDATKPLRALLVVLSGDPEVAPGAALEDEIRWRVDTLDVRRADTRFHSVEVLDLPADSAHGDSDDAHGDSRRNKEDVTILALFLRVADRKGSVGLPDAQLAAARRVLASGKPVIVACFGSPYAIARLPEARTWLAAFSTADVAQRAAARAIFGQVGIGGRIPVNVPGAVSLGAGIDVPANPMRLAPAEKNMESQLAPAYRWLEQAVARRDFPGGTLAVGLDNRLAVYAFGKFSPQPSTVGRNMKEPRAAAVQPDTIFDTASLTKPLVTTTLAAMLTESGQLDVDAPVARYIPEWADGARQHPEWRAAVTIRHLLTHTSGLPAHRKYFDAITSRRHIVAAAIAEPLESEPGARSVYSDISFLILGEAIERLTGVPLGELAQKRIFEPLAMKDTSFFPKKRRSGNGPGNAPSKALLARVAPVIDETRQHKPLPRGEVHDQNARAMGGVAPHAGVFSTAPDLAVFCQMLLNGGIYAHRRLLRRRTVERFTSASPLSGNMRTLGWMVPTPPSSSGRFFSPRSFGHLGFTGTSMWIDPDKRLFVVFLTNRVNPSREKIFELRAALHDEVVAALGWTADLTAVREKATKP